MALYKDNERIGKAQTTIRNASPIVIEISYMRKEGFKDLVN